LRDNGDGDDDDNDDGDAQNGLKVLSKTFK